MTLLAALIVLIQESWGIARAAPIPIPSASVVREEGGAVGCRLGILKRYPNRANAVLRDDAGTSFQQTASLRGLMEGPSGHYVLRGEWLWIKVQGDPASNLDAHHFELDLPKQLPRSIARGTYLALLLSTLIMAVAHRTGVASIARALKPLFLYEPSAIGRAPGGRVDFLDGIRGWAALMVLLSHTLGGFGLYGLDPVLRHWILALPSDGNLAVELFFVLSGFALSIQYIRTGDRNVITALALRRYPRLAIPIFFSCVAAYLLLKLGLMRNYAAASLLGDNAWLAGFYRFSPDIPSLFQCSFVDSLFHYNPNSTYNSSLWTMPIEFFGSMGVFLVAALFLHLRHRFGILIFIIASCCFEKSIYLPFFLGMAIAIYHETPVGRSLIAWPAALLSMTWATAYSTSTTVFAAWLGPTRSEVATSLTAAALVFSVTASVRLRALFSNSVSKYLASISFPLYLVHIPIICSYSSWLWIRLNDEGVPQRFSAWFTLLSTVVLALVCAHLFRRIENCAIKTARHFSDFFLRARV